MGFEREPPSQGDGDRRREFEIVAKITVDKILERNSATGLNIRQSGPRESARRWHSRGKIEGRRLANDEF